MMPCYAARDAEEASLLVLHLRAHGVAAAMREDLGAVAFGELPADVLRVDVFVPQGQLDRARELVATFRSDAAQARASRGQPWTCARCREPNEPTFEVCWNCQAAAPGAGHDGSEGRR